MEYNPVKYKINRALAALLVLILAALLYFYRGSLFPGFSGNKRGSELSEQQDQQVKEKAKLSSADEIALQEQTEEIVKGADLAACQKIENDMYQTVCRNNIILRKAKESDDATFCRQLDDNLVSIKSCERDIIVKKSYISDDVSICEEATDKTIQETCKQNILTIQAIKKNDSKICDNLDSDNGKASCSDTFIFAVDFVPNKRSFDCQKFSTDLFREDCLTYQKNIREDVSNPCMNVKTTVFSQFCKGSAQVK
jgi:hypothetical protein